MGVAVAAAVASTSRQIGQTLGVAVVGSLGSASLRGANYLDFAYYAFTIGMTFQVADTNITAKTVRRTTLHHALISYVFGAVLLGLVINVVATLLK